MVPVLNFCEFLLKSQALVHCTDLECEILAVSVLQFGPDLLFHLLWLHQVQDIPIEPLVLLTLLF